MTENIVLSRLEAACMDRQGKKESNEIRFLCPAHDDHHPSARFNPGKKVWTCDVCGTGGGWQDLARRLGIDIEEKKPGKRNLQIVATYDYGGWGGFEPFQVVRQIDNDTGKKQFYQRRPAAGGGWKNGLGKGFITCLYHGDTLAEMIAIGKTVYVVEGEKDVDRLRSIGFVATCNPMGAGKWRTHYSQTLAGADLVIIPDNDDPGRAHAAAVKQSCRQHAARIRVLELPDLPEKGDVSDWLDAGGTPDRLEYLTGKTSEQAASTMPALLKELSKKYDVVDGMMCLYKSGKDYENMPVPLCNFNAWITEEVTRDDSITRQMFLKVKGELPGGRGLPEIEVNAKDFDSMNWVTPNWGIRAIVDPSQNSVGHLRTAIKARTNGALLHRTVYTHYGWREIDGEMVFLHGAGAVGRNDVVVDPPDGLSRYMLVIEPSGDPKVPIQKSIDFLNVAPLEVSIPLWTAMYLAPLTEIVPQASAFTLWIAARSGSYKSVLTALALSHFGNFDYQTLPAKWTGTANRLEELLFLAKDLPLPIDDYAPAADQNAKNKQEQAVERIVRSQGDRVSRVRMYAPPRPPRGLLITSGEELTSGYSRTARILYVELEKSTVELPLLTEAQNEQYFYCEAMTLYIDWIRRNWKELAGRLPKRFQELRNKATIQGGHARMPQMIAGLQLGLETVMDFVRDMKVLTDSYCNALQDDGHRIFVDLATRQAAAVEEQSAARRFIDLLSAMHASGKLRFRPKNESITGDISVPAPGTENIGWFEHDDNGKIVYYVNMEAAIEAIQKYSRAFVWGKDAVIKDLDREGKIIRQDTHLTYKIRVGDSTPRVVKLNNEKLDGLSWK